MKVMVNWSDKPSEESESHTLLVVDDEESIRLMLEDILGVRYRVLTATDGVDALRVLASGEDEVDLVITDLRMPRMDGHDLATTLLSDYPHLGIFLITAHGTIDTAVEALQGGIHDYITKPLPANFSEIYAKCERFFQMRDLRTAQEKMQHQLLELSYFPRSNPHLVCRASLIEDDAMLFPANERTADVFAAAAGIAAGEGPVRLSLGSLPELFPVDFVDILKRIVGTDEVVEIDGVRWEERFLQHTYTPFVDNRSDIFIDLTDVTERRLAEVSVRQSEKRFRSIFEQSNDAIFLLDPSNEEILDVNPKACRILGYSREELLKLPISAIHPNEVHRMREFCGSVLEEGQGWTEDLTCTTIRGQSLAVEISASAANIAGRSCMIAMVRDQTAKVRTSQVLADEVQENYNYEEIIGESGALREVLNQVELVASTDTSVLILGESGTGKELICRALHHQSPRSAEPLIKLNCAAIPSGLIESELFGHEKGAFTGAVAQKRGRFELAHEGTIFLDEIGDLPLETQPKLLRLLQDQEFERVGGTRTIEVNVRVVAATHRNLEEMVREGDFREDLFYRLNVFPIRLPPLRERPEDIPLLAAYFAHKACAAMGKSTGKISDHALRRLQGYPWPGNVRELQNIIERGVILSQGMDLEAEHIQVEPVASATDNPGIQTLQEIEKDHIVHALRAAKGKVSGRGGAAELLGLKPTTLGSRMKKLGVSPDS